MQSLQLANDELSNNVTGIGEVEVVEICDGVSDFDWRIDTPEASIEPPLDEDFEQPNCLLKERVDELTALAESPSVFRRLQYLDHKEPHCPQTFPFLNCGQSSNLLEKLVFRNQLNMVLLTLHPGDKTYTLRLVAAGGKVIQVSDQTVGQDSLLEYIDRQELPPAMADEWDQVFPQLFYNGCVVVSLRDLRFSETPSLRCTILRPHNQSIISDVNSLVSNKSDYSHRERITLECSLVNSVQGDLCLDPSVSSGVRRLNQHFCDYMLHSTPLCKSVDKNGQRTISRQRRLQYRNSRIPLFDFLSKKRVKEKKMKEITGEKHVNEKEMDYLSSSQISVNIIQDVSMSARPISTPATNGDAVPQLVENCILKTEQKLSTIDHTELSIAQQRPHIGTFREKTEVSTLTQVSFNYGFSSIYSCVRFSATTLAFYLSIPIFKRLLQCILMYAQVWASVCFNVWRLKSAKKNYIHTYLEVSRSSLAVVEWVGEGSR